MVWTAIPGNEEAFEHLVEQVGKGEATAFVGAGASAGMCPHWEGLMADLADQAARRARPAEDRQTVKDYCAQLATTRPDQAAQQIREELGIGRLRDASR